MEPFLCLLSRFTVPLLFVTRNEAYPWVEVYPMPEFQSNWWTECNATCVHVAWLKKRKKQTKKEYEQSGVSHAFQFAILHVSANTFCCTFQLKWFP